MIAIIYTLLFIIGLLVLFACICLRAELKVVNQLVEVNRQLIFLAAGQDGKSETLRALVAAEKPPQKNLKGIASKKKKEDKLKNTDYTMKIGVS